MDLHLVLLLSAVASQIFIPMLRPNRHCRGVLTVRMLVLFITHVLNRIYPLLPMAFLRFFLFTPYLSFRVFLQIWPGLVLCTMLTFGGVDTWDYMCLWIILLYWDDFVTGGNDDRWKRRWKALKNKLKWRWTPAPVPVPHG